MKLSLFLGALIMIVFTPSFCFADAFVPLSNLFTPETAVSSAIITSIVMIIEALFLRWQIKTVSFSKSLWRSFLVNLSSSAAGSIAVIFLKQKDPILFSIFKYIGPLFLLTLVIETPILIFLYRKDPVGWLRLTKYSVIMNTISYTFILGGQILLVYGFIWYGGLSDRRTLKQWNDSSVLDGQTGFIYVSENRRGDYPNGSDIRQYDVKNKSWKTIDVGGHGIVSDNWDVKGDLLACVRQSESYKTSNPLVILRLPSLKQECSVPGQFKGISLSPDLNMFAALEFVREETAQENESRFYLMGCSCKLQIYSTKTGHLLFQSPKLALDEGLCWTKNSNSVIFTSFKDEKYFLGGTGHLPHNILGQGYVPRNQIITSLFSYDLKTGKVSYLADGVDPFFVDKTNNVSFIRNPPGNGFNNTSIQQIDLSTGKELTLYSHAFREHHCVSPNGKLLLLPLPPKQPLGGGDFLTIIDPSNEVRKFILVPKLYGLFKWLDNETYQTLVK